ncbi:hypothetical protein HAX54_044090 [Datura stramonium]|uniref:Uncharacterized protein n=1 Tax=Datura stramonium TaxID=4076 RepID=A0ABS8W234_DATST|nr:hypothetical protein [Datura stramonium]
MGNVTQSSSTLPGSPSGARLIEIDYEWKTLYCHTCCTIVHEDGAYKAKDKVIKGEENLFDGKDDLRQETQDGNEVREQHKKNHAPS